MASFCACGMLVFLSLFLISFTPHCNGGNILVVPVDGSHWVNLKILLEELHARGHNLTVIRPSTSWYISEKSDLYTSITAEKDEDLEHFFRWARRGMDQGGFQCKPAQPLPAELEEFVQSAGQHGVIIMTLGTYVNALPKEIANEIASVFAEMPQKVIWRHKGDRPSTLGNNTLLVDWMPQKDLLGHPQTKVFVAHGGTNGVQEAIYYGVPVLGIPLFFDQYDNLLRLQERGAAKIIQLVDVNGHSFEQGLKEVIHQESYRQNIQRMSRLHRDQPITPMEQAVFWVEYVMRHKGARHLRTEAYKMPWYSYYSLDVLFILLSVVTALLLSVLSIFRFLCCKRVRKIKAKQS